MSADCLLELIESSLTEDKATDIVSISLREKTTLTDYMVIATGRSQRHVSAIADHVLECLKQNGQGPLGVEGLRHGDWVLIDSGDVIVHVFRQEVREFYNLEKMWSLDLPVSENIPSYI